MIQIGQLLFSLIE